MRRERTRFDRAEELSVRREEWRIQAQVAEKRMADALETCKLTTEIHPFNWHSWFNLGLVQRQIGKNQEAFASHQCVNKVDPNNHTAAAIRQRLAELGCDKTPEPPECPVH